MPSSCGCACAVAVEAHDQPVRQHADPCRRPRTASVILDGLSRLSSIARSAGIPYIHCIKQSTLSAGEAYWQHGARLRSSEGPATAPMSRMERPVLTKGRWLQVIAT